MGDLVFICVLLVYLRQQIVGPSAKRVTTNHERSTIGRAERGSWRPLRPCNGGTREARRRGHFLCEEIFLLALISTIGLEII